MTFSLIVDFDKDVAAACVCASIASLGLNVGSRCTDGGAHGGSGGSVRGGGGIVGEGGGKEGVGIRGGGGGEAQGRSCGVTSTIAVPV